MNKENAIAIFDIGKTNKKLFLFNEDYQIIFEESRHFDEIKDEDGFPCEDVLALTDWIKKSVDNIIALESIEIRVINFSAYGASFVHVDKQGKPITPLYNYLKPFPEKLKQQFYNTYGGETDFSQATASPVLGNLNSGLQLYRLKYEKPKVFEKIECSLHLPQYIGSIIARKNYSDITSIGCHTAIWDFQHNKYHRWIFEENISDKLAAISDCDQVQQIQWNENDLKIGIGMHDSSSALVPYLLHFSEPFVLLSTGTWNINLNPFNGKPLTAEELQKDCLCYLTHEAKPVKASRLFAGYEYELQVKRIASHFNQQTEKYASLVFNNETARFLKYNEEKCYALKDFAQRDLHEFENDEKAYYQLMTDLVLAQVSSTNLIMNNDVKQIFVDGGFSKNSFFMNLLANVFQDKKIFAATVAQASSLGAALVIHKHWNKKEMPSDIIELKLYPPVFSD